jgi:hypothetical protein
MTRTSNDALSMLEIWFFDDQDNTRLHKLNSRWEGSFIVHKFIGPRSYRLQCRDGQEVPNS